jgi:ABC-type Fe3+/spermidine/putrescine transport system ATPase subunit
VQETYAPGARITLIARPEMIQVRPEGAFGGVVRRATYLGDVVDYEVEVGGQLLTAAESDPRRITTIHPEGSQVNIDLLADCLHILPA